MLPCIPGLHMEVKVDFAFLKFFYVLIMFPRGSNYLFSVFAIRYRFSFSLLPPKNAGSPLLVGKN